MTESLPHPHTTLVIILGASEFPKASNRLSASPAFLNSAESIRDYFSDENGFCLPKQNLLFLFDAPDPSSQLDEKVRDFLQDRIGADGAEKKLIRDVLVYYIGHGGFAGSRSEYYLALRDTRLDNGLSTSYAIASLAKTLKTYARTVRRYLILDSCFSAAAYTEFMAGPLEVASMQMDEALPPQQGTALLCASGAREPAKAPKGATHTMFTGALLEVLRKGEQSDQKSFSFVKIAELTEAAIRLSYDDDAVRPEIHFPEQRLGSIGALPFFPNPGAKLTSIDVQLEIIKQSLEKVSERQDSLSLELLSLRESQGGIERSIVKTLPASDDVDAIYPMKGAKKIGRRKVPLKEWNMLPFTIKKQVVALGDLYYNGLIWVSMCVAAIICTWFPTPYPVAFFLGLSTSLFLTICSLYGMNRQRYWLKNDDYVGDHDWEHLDVVILLRRSVPVVVLFGMIVERKILSVTMIFLIVNIFGGLLVSVPSFIWTGSKY